MRSLKNKKVLITAGSAWIPLDKVRVITTIFTGTLGLFIAKEALKREAKVTLFLGQGGTFSQKNFPKNLKVFRFKFFDELLKLMKKEISSKKYEIIIHTAALPDYAPINYYKGKISSQFPLVIKLKPTIKIVDQIKKWDPKVFLVKFKLEVNLNKKTLLQRAFKSMLVSDADLMVANDLKDIKEDLHKALIIDRDKKIIICKTKEEISRKLLDLIAQKILN